VAKNFAPTWQNAMNIGIPSGADQSAANPHQIGCCAPRSHNLADWVQHIPRARQHQAATQPVTYAGWFANALGNLNPKKDSQTNAVEELTERANLANGSSGAL
jgi:hypothetical protein